MAGLLKTFNRNPHFRKGFCRGSVLGLGVGGCVLVPLNVPIAAVAFAGTVAFILIHRVEFGTWRLWRPVKMVPTPLRPAGNFREIWCD